MNLLDGPSEPLPRTDDPEAHRVRKDDAHCDNRVVERLRIDGIRLREDERDGDEEDPADGGDGDGVGGRAEVERPAHEVLAVDDAEGDGDTYVKGLVVGL